MSEFDEHFSRFAYFPVGIEFVLLLEFPPRIHNHAVLGLPRSMRHPQSFSISALDFVHVFFFMMLFKRHARNVRVASYFFVPLACVTLCVGLWFSA